MRLSWVSCGPGAGLGRVWEDVGILENERGWHGPGERVVRTSCWYLLHSPLPTWSPAFGGRASCQRHGTARVWL